MTGAASRGRKNDRPGPGGGAEVRGVRAAPPRPTTARDGDTWSSDRGRGIQKLPAWVNRATCDLIVTRRTSTPFGRTRVSNRGTWSSGSRGRAAGSTGRVCPASASDRDVQTAPLSLVIWTYSWAAASAFSG